jgi:hypothetical protein
MAWKKSEEVMYTKGTHAHLRKRLINLLEAQYMTINLSVNRIGTVDMYSTNV